MLGVVAAAEGIDHLGYGRCVDDPIGEHAAQDAMDSVIKAGHGDLVALDGGFERVAEILRAGLFLIEAG